MAEGVYANDGRSDIRVSFAGLNVPVEIKRSCHDDLWTAVHDQLIAQYTRGPGVYGDWRGWRGLTRTRSELLATLRGHRFLNRRFHRGDLVIGQLCEASALPRRELPAVLHAQSHE